MSGSAFQVGVGFRGTGLRMETQRAGLAVSILLSAAATGALARLGTPSVGTLNIHTRGVVGYAKRSFSTFCPGYAKRTHHSMFAFRVADGLW